MSFLSSFTGAIGDIFGGNQSAPATHSGAAQNVTDLNNQLINNLTTQYATSNTQNSDAVNKFQSDLNNFLTNNPNGSPGANSVADATKTVDQTFTQPAQAAVNQQISNATSGYQARAAALGRDPNLDQSTNQSIANTAVQANLGLQEQRGQRIQQQTQQNYGNSLQSLQASSAGAGFLNNLGQQAFTNRLNTLNQNTIPLNYSLGATGQDTAHMQTNPGFLGSLSSGISGLSNFGSQSSALGSQAQGGFSSLANSLSSSGASAGGSSLGAGDAGLLAIG